MLELVAVAPRLEHVTLLRQLVHRHLLPRKHARPLAAKTTAFTPRQNGRQRLLREESEAFLVQD